MILREPDWNDFGPTFASQQLAKLHQIHGDKETLRRWMIEAHGCRFGIHSPTMFPFDTPRMSVFHLGLE
jgi:hypothetical protein